MGSPGHIPFLVKFLVSLLIAASLHTSYASSSFSSEMSALPSSTVTTSATFSPSTIGSDAALATARSTSPNELFRAIIILTPLQPSPPVCCLRPLPDQDAGQDDVLLLSFEDWKAKQKSDTIKAQQAAQAEANRSAVGSNGAQSSSSSSVAASPGASALNGADGASQDELGIDGIVNLAQDDTTPSLSPISPEPAMHQPPHFRVPLHDRFNYASLDCSARIHTAHKSAKSASSILSSKQDKYMLSPCSSSTHSEKHYVVVELCEDIRIDTVQLANFEFFSGVFKEFSVSVAQTLPGPWTDAGTYKAKNIRGVQSFHPPTSLRDFYRYIRLDFHSHYGNEYYCPVSLLRVYGLTHLEQWKWDLWEAEYRVEHGDSDWMGSGMGMKVAMGQAEMVLAGQVDAVLNGELPSDDVMESEKTTTTTATASSSIPSTPPPEVMASMSMTPTASDAHQEASTEAAQQILTVAGGSGKSKTSVFSSLHAGSAEDVDSSLAVPTTTGDMVDNSTISDSSSAAGTTSTTENASMSQDTPSAPSSSSSPTITIIASPPHHPSSSPSSAPASLQPYIPSSGGGESIYKVIMNRLTALEDNTTLYARYAEEQSAGMREVLRRLGEDVGRLEGIGKAHSQAFHRTIREWEIQRRRLDNEFGMLKGRVEFLADEIVLEKRLSIAQLCLLLAVLVFMALTRGSNSPSPHTMVQQHQGTGSFHVPEVMTRSASMKEWGRRHLKLSFSGLRRGRSGGSVISPDGESPGGVSERTASQSVEREGGDEMDIDGSANKFKFPRIADSTVLLYPHQATSSLDPSASSSPSISILTATQNTPTVAPVNLPTPANTNILSEDRSLTRTAAMMDSPTSIACTDASSSPSVRRKPAPARLNLVSITNHRPHTPASAARRPSSRPLTPIKSRVQHMVGKPLSLPLAPGAAATEPGGQAPFSTPPNVTQTPPRAGSRPLLRRMHSSGSAATGSSGSRRPYSASGVPGLGSQWPSSKYVSGYGGGQAVIVAPRSARKWARSAHLHHVKMKTTIGGSSGSGGSDGGAKDKRESERPLSVLDFGDAGANGGSMDSSSTASGTESMWVDTDGTGSVDGSDDGLFDPLS